MAENTVKVKIDGDASGLIGATETAKGAITGLATHAAGAVGGFANLATGAAKELGKIGIAATTVASGVISALAFKGLKGAAQFEDYNVQFSTMIRNSDDFKNKYKGVTDGLQLQGLAAEEANKKMAELAKFGAETPFDLPQVVEAQRVLMGFGLAADNASQRFGQSGADILRISGDVASGTGADFKEIALDIGKFSAGATGEAISRFQELGIVTRNELTEMGLKFSKSGELIVNSQADMDKATGILLNAMKNKYGGLMQAQSATLNGMLSNMRDWVDGTLREVSKPLFEPVKKGLQSVLDYVGSDAGKAAVQKLTIGVQAGVDKVAEYFRIGRDSFITFKAALNGDWTNSIGIEPVTRVLGEFGVLLRDTIIPTVTSLVEKLAPVVRTFYDIYSAVSPLSLAFAAFQGFLSGGLDGALQAIGDRVANVGAIFGVDLTGAIQNVINFITGTLVPGFQNFVNFISTNIGPALSSIGTFIANNVLPALGNIGNFITGTVIPAFQAFGGWIATNIGPILEALGNAIVTKILPALQNLGNFIMTNVVPALQGLFQWIGENVVPVLEKLANFIATAVIPVLANIAAFIIDTVVPALIKIVETIATFLKPVFEGLSGFIQNVVIPAFTAIANFINDPVIPAFTSVANFISNNVMPVLSDIAGFLGGAVKTAFDTMGSAIKGVADIVSGIFTTVMNGIKGVINFVIDAVNGLIDGVNFLGGAFGVHIDKLKHVDEAQDDTRKNTNDLTNAYHGLTGQISGAGQALLDYARNAQNAANAPTPSSGGGGKGGGASAKALGGLTSGLTLWGEAGPELASVPNRGLMLASAPTLTDFPSGTRVYSTGETKQLTTNMGGVTINVYGAPGMDVYTLAQEVKKALDEQSGMAALNTRLRN